MEVSHSIFNEREKDIILEKALRCSS